MPVSHYFNNFAGNQTSEQRVLEDIVVESIRIMGHDCYYLPREAWAEDDFVLGENVTNRFRRAYVIETYLANVEGYEGDGDFFSKFGLEIRDTTNLIISRRAFEKYVPADISIRPKEGDLIYVPVLQKILEIKFVEEELLFFSLGKTNPYIYELRCELFRYNNEDINTGIEDVDDLEDTLTYTIGLEVNNGNSIHYRYNETVYQGSNLASATASAEVKEWNPANNIIYIKNIKGEFTENANVIGVTSNARYNVTDVDSLGDNLSSDLFDNKQIQDDANSFISFAEINPFGTP